jgi:hypothetical protein
MPSIRTKQQFHFWRVHSQVDKKELIKEDLGSVAMHCRTDRIDDRYLGNNNFTIGDYIDVSINYKWCVYPEQWMIRICLKQHNKYWKMSIFRVVWVWSYRKWGGRLSRQCQSNSRRYERKVGRRNCLFENIRYCHTRYWHYLSRLYCSLAYRLWFADRIRLQIV